MRKFYLFSFIVFLLSVAITGTAQTLWSSASSSAWLTATYWTGSTVPGSATVTNNTDWAQFGVNPTSAGTGVGINMNTANGNWYLGAIEITSSRTNNFLIGNSAGSKDGVLTLNGTTINSTGNVILRNNSAGTFTIQDIQGTGAAHLGLTPGNATNNVVRIDGTGNIVISSIISGANPLSLTGTGTGKLQLTAANTYTGTLTVNATTLQLNRTGGTTLPITNNVVVSGGTLQISTNQTLNNLTLAAGATLTIDNGVVLTVAGTFNQNGGTINGTGTIAYGTNAVLSYGGTAAQATGTELATTLPNLTINNGSGVSLNSATRVTGVLKLQLGVLTSNNKLTLASTATGTAALAPVADYTTTNINGNVTVERYIPAHAARAYTMVCSAASGQSIYNSWQEGGASIPGYGTQISGASAGNGFDFASAAGIAGIYTYNDTKPTGQKWVGLNNTNTTLQDNFTGLLLFVRGDRTVGAGSGAPTATTLRSTGTIYIGPDIELATVFGSNMYSLNANPYACAIRWSTMYRNDVNSSFTVYDPNLQTFVTSNGSIVSPSTSQQQANIIQSGQAFFCQTVSNPSDPHLVAHETDKVIAAATGTSNTVFGVDAKPTQLNINIYHGTAAQPTGFADGAVAIFGDSFSPGLGTEDVSKFTNFNETFGLSRAGKILSIEGRPVKTTFDTLYCNMQNMKQNDYSFTIDASGFSTTTTATLVDNYTGAKQLLDLTKMNNYDFTVNTDAGSSTPGRFIIVLSSAGQGSTTNEPTAITGVQVKLGPNPFNNQLMVNFSIAGAETKTVRLLNSLGQVMKVQAAGDAETGTLTINTGDLLPGTYIIEVLKGKNKIFIQQIVKLR